MEFVAKRMPDLCATDTQIGTSGDHFVIGPNDGQLSDAMFEASASQLAPTSTQNPITEFHHGLERKQDWLWTNQLAASPGEQVGAVTE
ncbi:MAG TPA: hypothetical protein VML93_31350 [Mycobacterium sp.]|nr:hypothetical protein [Mycobacterium sp.]HTQ21717.1 hypothetical protein [Mycobacterium sp.]